MQAAMNPEDFPDFEALMRLLQLGQIGTLELGTLASDHQATTDALKGFDPLLTAATFGALLTVPDLMTNGTRLEVLAHLALEAGELDREPSGKLLADCFAAIGQGVCGGVEDPAEDLFVGLVRSPRGAFRVIEGVWESAAFFLQRVIGVIEGMPKGSAYDHLRDSIYALLRLSDLVCERANLRRYQLGGEMPAKAIPAPALADPQGLRKRVRFTKQDLNEAGIAIDDLAAFIFNPEDRRTLVDQMIGHTLLERYPVAHRDDEFFLVLPTGVSLAIRRFLVKAMDEVDMRPAMLAGLAREYASLFHNLSLLGGPRGADVEFLETASGYFAGVMVDIDRGRHLNILFVMDNLQGFETDTFAGSNLDPTAVADDLDQFIDHAMGLARADPEFREGLTLIVGCGYGRQVEYALNNVARPSWRVEMISAPDLCVLSCAPDFKPLSLWRILDARDSLERQGLVLQNVNGLLNLVAWARSLKGHLVPHGQLPDDFADAGVGAMVMVSQNSLLELREQVAEVWDPHMLQDLSGRWVKVRRDGLALFAEDLSVPLFASEEQPVGAYESASRTWWCEVETPDHVKGAMAYQRWKTSTTWLARAVPVLEHAFPDLPPGSILWRTVYEGDLADIDQGETSIGYADAVAELTVEADLARGEIVVRATRRYELAHLNSENLAERALVAALTAGVAKLADHAISDEAREALVTQIVPDPLARQQHAFANPTLRDHVQPSLPKRVILIDDLDDAASRLGLGWKVRQRGADPWIEGKSDATGFLNALVSRLEDELAADLRQFDRASLLHMVLRNHEAAAIDRDHWRRTAAALVALHTDKAAAREVIARHEFKLNMVFQTSRLLIEFAICECPLLGGRRAAELDLKMLMAQAGHIFSIGGWSDAIRWEVMEPKLRVTPMGDVHANWDFVDQVLEPFSLAAAETRLDEAIEDYPKNLQKPETVTSLADAFEPAFLAAFEAEFGATIDQVRTFVEFVEDIAVKSERAVVMLPRSSLLNVQTDLGELDEEVALRIVDALTFHTRPRWRETPAGYENRDRFPWRFRRRLTLLRKPLLRIDDQADPTYIVAPAQLREAFVYTVSNFHGGGFADYQLSPAMRRWAGKIADTRGRKFSEDVAARLRKLGWEAEVEVKVTKLLRRSFDRDFGDVDVLAWNPATGRVIAIECKDVQYRKTYGEVAEQLADFRGEARANGKPDYLLLHLNRMDLLGEHLPQVAAYLGWKGVERVESHLLFRHPVPMTYALGRLSERVTVSTLASLATI
jgi:hypothetical protein